jgi:hypothetical protein
VALLPEVAALVVKAFPSAVFLIVGRDAGVGSSVLRRVNELGLDGSVRILGPQNDVEPLYAMADVVFVPSWADPLPLVALEAMRSGLPLVATRSGGCEELVADGETGYLVSPGDVATMADRLIQLLGDREASRLMGERGRYRFRHLFGLDRCLTEWAEVLQATHGSALCPSHPLGAEAEAWLAAVRKLGAFAERVVEGQHYRSEVEAARREISTLNQSISLRIARLLGRPFIGITRILSRHATLPLVETEP